MKIASLAIVSLALGLTAATTVAAQSDAQKQTFTYTFETTWEGGRQWSTAPGPYCECDLDQNKIDCTEASFESSKDVGELCYDEYIIPGDATYANVFKRQ